MIWQKCNGSDSEVVENFLEFVAGRVEPEKFEEFDRETPEELLR